MPSLLQQYMGVNLNLVDYVDWEKTSLFSEFLVI